MENIKIAQLRKLRKDIDALDSSLIKIIQKRISASKLIGKLKAETALPVFCPQREKDVLQNALRLSKRLGVNSGLSEKILQLVIQECRKSQFEFVKKPSIIIIGNGKMGKMLSEEFNADISKKECDLLKAESPKIVILAVPFSALSEVANRIKNFLNNEDLAIDISSTKTGADEILSKLPCGFLATHPLFGPKTGMTGQKWVITGEKANKLSRLFKDFISAKGCKIIHMAPEAHDKAMAILQGLNHFMLIAFLRTIRDFNLDAKKLEKFSTACSKLTLEAVNKVSTGGIRTSRELTSKPMAKVAINKFIGNAIRIK